jgi:hypothetical protein
MISTLVEKYSAKVLENSNDFFQKEADLFKEVKDHYWAFKGIFDLIPDDLSSFFSGHHLPFFESDFELDTSFYLAKKGLYRHSFSGLRTILEISLLYIYYDLNDNGPVDIQGWVHSREDTPLFTRKIISNIFRQDPFKSQDFKYLEDEIKNHYWELCNYTHLKGKKYSNKFLGSQFTNTVMFNQDSLKKYIDNFKSTIRYILTIYSLKYPISMLKIPLEEKFGIDRPCGHFLNEYQSEAWKLIIGDISKSIEELAQKDIVAQQKLKDILEMDDISEEQVDEQIFKLHTDSILSQGYENWLKGSGHYFLSETGHDNDESKNRKERLVKKFEEYAKNHNCLVNGLSLVEIHKLKMSK